MFRDHYVGHIWRQTDKFLHPWYIRIQDRFAVLTIYAVTCFLNCFSRSLVVPEPVKRRVWSELWTKISRSLKVTHKTFRHFQLVHGRTPIPMAARSKARVCGRSLCWDSGFESHLGHVYLSLANIFVVRYRSLRSADLSSRGVRPSMVCLSVTSKPQRWGGRGPLELSNLGKKKWTHIYTHPNIQMMVNSINSNCDLRY